MASITLPVINQKIKVTSDIRGTKEIEDSLGRIPGIAKRVGDSISAAVTVPLAGAGLAAFNSFVSVDKQLREVNTLTGLTGAAAEQNFGVLTAGVKELSGELGVAKTELSGGLYQALSAGVPQDNAFDFLEIASKAAIAGVTDTTTAIDGITTVINAFGLDASDAQSVADSLFAAVAGGKTTFGELSRAISQVAPAAAASGVGIEEINAAIATLTASGIKTNTATTQLRAAIVALQRPTDELTAVFRAAGYETGEAAIRSDGLANAFNIVREATGGSNSELTKLLGTVEAVDAVNVIAGTSAGKFAQELDRQANSAGSATAAYEEIEKSLGRRIERIKVQFINFGGEVIEAVLPAIEIGLQFAGAITSTWDRIPGPIQTVISTLGLLVAAAGPVLSIGARLASPFVAAFQQIAKAQQQVQTAKAFDAIYASAGRAGPAVASSIPATTKAVAAFGKLVPVVGAASLAFAAAPAVISLFNKSKREQEARIRAVEDALISENGVLDTSTEAWARYIAETSRFESRNQLDDLTRLDITFSDLQAQLRGGAQGYQEFTEAAIASGEVQRTNRVATQAEIELFNLYTDSQNRILVGNTDLVRSFELEQEALVEAASAGLEKLQLNDQLTESQLQLIDSTYNLADANADVIGAQEAAGEQVEVNRLAADALGTTTEDLVQKLNGFTEASTEGGQSVDELVSAFFEIESAEEKAAAATENVREQVVALLQDAGATEEQIDEFNSRFEETASAADDAAGGVEEVTHTVIELSDETLTAAESIEALADALDSSLSDAISHVQAVDNLAESQEELAEVYANSVGEIDAQTEAGRELRDSLIDVVEGTLEVAAAGKTQSEAILAQQSAIEALKQQYPEAAALIDELTASLQEVPPETIVSLEIQQTGVEGDLHAIAESLAGFGADPAVATIEVDAGHVASAIALAGVQAEGSGQTVGQAAASGTAAGITAGQPIVGSAMTGLVATATTSVSATALSGGAGLGRSISSGMQSGVQQGAPGVSSAATAAVNRALASARAAAGAASPARVFADQVGLPIAQGIAQGIGSSSAVRAIISASRSTIDTSLKAAQDRGRIRSPSALFRVGVGEPITEGVAKGILEKRSEAEDAVGELMDTLEQEARARLSAVTGAINAGLGSIGAGRALRDARDRSRYVESNHYLSDRLREVQEGERGVEAARRDLEESERDLEELRTRGVADAQRSIEEAQRELEYARTRGVADAKRELDDARRELEEARRFGVSDALRRLDDARRELEDVRRTARRDADRAMEDAQEGLTDARVEREEAAAALRQEEEYLAKAREHGNAVVIAAFEKRHREAQRRFRDANRDVEDQQFDLEDARRAQGDVARQIVDAEREVIDAEQGVQDAHREVADRARDVADAETEVVEQRREIEERTRALTDAQRDLEQVHRDVADAQRELEERGRALGEANVEFLELQRGLADIEQVRVDASEDLAEAQLAAVDAQLALRDAGAELIEQGPDGIRMFEELADAVGISSEAVDGLLDRYARLAAGTAADDNRDIQGVGNLFGDETASAPAGGGGGRAYTVVRGDTLSAIAANHGVSLAELLEKNPRYRANPNRINVGDVVQLAEGGMIRARPGGTLALMAEARRDEIALPLGSAQTTAALADALRQALGAIGFGGVDIDVEINNPVPETSSTSVSRELRKLAGVGLFG